MTEFNNGYWAATDDILSWINSVDSGDMLVKDFRSAINKRILDMRPPKDERTTTT